MGFNTQWIKKKWTTTWDTGFVAGRNLVPSFGLTLWLDADRTPTGSVATWTDYSGNGYNATQGTAGKQPVCTANQLNGKKTLLFTAASSQTLALPSGINAIANGNNTWIVVAKRNTETAAANYIFSIVQAGVAVTNAIDFSASSGNIIYFSSATAGTATKSGATNTNYQIISGRRTGTTLEVTYNNNTVASTTNGSNAPLSDTAFIGSNGGTLQFLNGGIAEIIAYNRSLSNAELLQVDRYLSNKWGITIV